MTVIANAYAIVKKASVAPDFRTTDLPIGELEELFSTRNALGPQNEELVGKEARYDRTTDFDNVSKGFVPGKLRAGNTYSASATLISQTCASAAMLTGQNAEIPYWKHFDFP